jgi:uncharacterized hydrophobic protein (TIGR00271 family)
MNAVTPEEIERLREELVYESILDQNYIVLTVGACLIATFGLLSNSAAVIIGAMIIAPLMLPLRGLALAILEGDLELLYASLKTLGTGTGITLPIAWLLGRLFDFPELGSEILARTAPTLLDLGIAFAAGAIGGVAKIRPQIRESLAGTAIAVALMPPLCVVGLSLSQGHWGYAWGATLLYLTNLLGITLACTVVFFLAGYAEPVGGRTPLGLKVTVILNLLLVIPLGASLLRLSRQAQLEDSLRRFLQQRTITVGQQATLVGSEINWQRNPPEVRLRVRSNSTLTSTQVQAVEQFVEKEMGQTFRLIFEVDQVREVTANEQDEFPQVTE